MTNTKSELLRQLYDKYNLYVDKDNPENRDNDIYKHKHYTIITRGGIQKIERAAGIVVGIDVLASGPDYCNVRAVGTLPTGESYTTFASANSLTSKSAYYVEMAEKRVRARVILTLAGLYELGVFGEDEADDFADTVKSARSASTVNKTEYKGGVR